MSERLNRLVASYNKSTEKCEKIEKTIERHFAWLDKKLPFLEQKGHTFLREFIQGLDFTLNSVEFDKAIKPVENLKWGDKESVEHYWELCDFVGKLEDLRGSHSKLADARQVNLNWQEKINKENDAIHRLNSVPQEILQYLENWANEVYHWLLTYNPRLAPEEVQEIVQRAKNNLITEFAFNIMPITGNIHTIDYITMGEKGELNGVFRGDLAAVSVETISAGGYYIQRFHYRTLVHKLS